MFANRLFRFFCGKANAVHTCHEISIIATIYTTIYVFEMLTRFPVSNYELVYILELNFLVCCFLVTCPCESLPQMKEIW